MYGDACSSVCDALLDIAQQLKRLELTLAGMHWCMGEQWHQLSSQSMLPATEDTLFSNSLNAVLDPGVPTESCRVFHENSVSTSKRRRRRANNLKQRLWAQSCGIQKLHESAEVQQDSQAECAR